MRKFLFFAVIGIIAMSCETNPPIGKINQGYCGAQGNNLTWILTKDGVLTIRGNGKMADFHDDFMLSIPWFHYQGDIKTVVIEYGVASIGNMAFFGCANLTSVTIPNSVTTIGNSAFELCRSLASIIIPNSVTTIGHFAFADCTSLTSVRIPESVTSIGNGAFYQCANLTSITIGNGVTSIGAYAFQKSGLTFLTIPNSVTDIGRYAFAQNDSLTSVTIGSGITTIRNGVFSGNRNLITITSYAPTPPSLENHRVFDRVNYETAILHVPAQSLELYRQAEGWRLFQNIVAIE